MDPASVAKVLIFVLLVQGTSCQNWLNMILGSPPPTPKPRRPSFRRNRNMAAMMGMNPFFSAMFGGMGGGGGGGGGLFRLGGGASGPDPFMRQNQITTAEEQMAEVLTESGKTNPDRVRMEGVIRQAGGKFTGDLAALNYIVQDFWMTTPGPVPPPNKPVAKTGPGVMPAGGAKGGMRGNVALGAQGVKPAITWQQLGTPSNRRRSKAAMAAMNRAGGMAGPSAMAGAGMGMNNNFNMNNNNGMGGMPPMGGQVPGFKAMGIQNIRAPQPTPNMAANRPRLPNAGRMAKPAGPRMGPRPAKKPRKPSRQQQIQERIMAIRAELDQLRAKTVNGKNPKMLGVQNQLNGLVKLQKTVTKKAKRRPKNSRVEVLTRPPITKPPTQLKQGTIPVQHRGAKQGMTPPTTAGYDMFGLVNPAAKKPRGRKGGFGGGKAAAVLPVAPVHAPDAIAYIPPPGQGATGAGTGQAAGAAAGAEGAATPGTTQPPQLGEVRYLHGHKYVYTDADGFDTFQWIKQAPGTANQNQAEGQQAQEGQGQGNQAQA